MVFFGVCLVLLQGGIVQEPTRARRQSSSRTVESNLDIRTQRSRLLFLRVINRFIYCFLFLFFSFPSYQCVFLVVVFRSLLPSALRSLSLAHFNLFFVDVVVVVIQLITDECCCNVAAAAAALDVVFNLFLLLL